MFNFSDMVSIISKTTNCKIASSRSKAPRGPVDRHDAAARVDCPTPAHTPARTHRQAHTGAHWRTLAHTGTHRHTQAHADTCRHLQTHTHTHEDTHTRTHTRGHTDTGCAMTTTRQVVLQPHHVLDDSAQILPDGTWYASLVMKQKTSCEDVWQLTIGTNGVEMSTCGVGVLDMSKISAFFVFFSTPSSRQVFLARAVREVFAMSEHMFAQDVRAFPTVGGRSSDLQALMGDSGRRICVRNVGKNLLEPCIPPMKNTLNVFCATLRVL